MENEIRVLLQADECLEDRALQAGFVETDWFTIHDRLFCPQSVTSLDQIRMNSVGSYSLRVRTYTSAGQTRHTLNSKQIVDEGNHGFFDEHETGLSSSDEACSILEAVGFKVYCTMHKKRRNYTLGAITLHIEDIRDFGRGLELEFISSDTVRARELLISTLDTLSINPDRIVKRSLTALYLEQHAYF